MTGLCAVVPIKLGEGHKTDSGGLLDMLLSSIQRYCEVGLFDSIHIVCPPTDVLRLREQIRRWPRLPIRVLDERTLFDGISIRDTTPGWAIQQLVKMAACRIIDTDFYLTLDADCFCIRNARREDFINGGRGLIHIESKEYHPAWWTESCKILGSRADLDKPGMSVTPAILSRTAMSEMLKKLDGRHGDWAAHLQTYYQPLHWNTLKQSLLKAVWTEYSLYFSFLEMYDSVWEFHFDGSVPAASRGVRTLVSANSVWRAEDFERWSPDCVFAGGDPASFAVIQSSLRLSVEDIRRKLAGYL